MNSNVVAFPGVPIPRTTIKDLVARFAEVEALENPDIIVPLSELRRKTQPRPVSSLGADLFSSRARA